MKSERVFLFKAAIGVILFLCTYPLRQGIQAAAPASEYEPAAQITGVLTEAVEHVYPAVQVEQPVAPVEL